MNHDQQLSELIRKEDFLYQKERAILKEKRSLEDEMNRFEGYSFEAHRLLWNSFDPILPLEISLINYKRKFFMNPAKCQIVIWKN